MRFAMIVMLILLPCSLHADLFTADQDDHLLTSAPRHERGLVNSNVKALPSTALLREDQVDQGIRSISEKLNKENISSSPLLFWEYSAPVEADVYKHYQAIAYLRYGQDLERLREVEGGGQTEIAMLRKQAVSECVERELKNRGIGQNISKIIDDCSIGDPFKNLNEADNANVFGKIIARTGLSAQEKKAMLDLMPTWQISKSGITYNYSAKGIGSVFHDFKSQNVAMINEALDQYKQDKAIAEQTQSKLQSLNFAERSFVEQDMIHLLSLEEPARSDEIKKIAHQFAKYQTKSRYNQAIEMLSRYSNNPNWNEVYRSLMIKGIQYLEHEKISFNDVLDDIDRNDQALNAMRARAREEGQKIFNLISSDQEQKAVPHS